MSKKEENVPFICIACEKYVMPLQNGSYRNHCPFCLMSIHVDNTPGDRKSECNGLMIPYKLVYKGSKGWQIVHKCKQCSHEKANKIAVDDSQEDNWELIIRLSPR
jgi:hypothetical protein